MASKFYQTTFTFKNPKAARFVADQALMRDERDDAPIAVVWSGSTEFYVLVPKANSATLAAAKHRITLAVQFVDSTVQISQEHLQPTKEPQKISPETRAAMQLLWARRKALAAGDDVSAERMFQTASTAVLEAALRLVKIGRTAAPTRSRLTHILCPSAPK
jgi:hypothetical protein